MIAALPMYDRAETAGANDRLWGRIRDAMRLAGVAAPTALTRGVDDLWPHWTSTELAFSQTCGFPYRARLHGRVTLIGTPDFGLDGCPPGYYRSLFLARRDDPRESLADFATARFAYNDAMSQSGWAAAQNHVTARNLRLTPALRSGGHRASALAVAEDRADLAAIDAVTWAMLHRWEPFTADLRVIGATEPTPGLPYIAAAGADAGRMRAIVAEAIAAMDAADRDATGLRGVIAIPAADYLAVPIPLAPTGLAGAE